MRKFLFKEEIKRSYLQAKMHASEAEIIRGSALLFIFFNSSET